MVQFRTSESHVTGSHCFRNKDIVLTTERTETHIWTCYILSGGFWEINSRENLTCVTGNYTCTCTWKHKTDIL